LAQPAIPSAPGHRFLTAAQNAYWFSVGTAKKVMAVSELTWVLRLVGRRFAPWRGRASPARVGRL